MGSKHLFHRDLEQAVVDSSRFGFFLIQAYARKFRIGEKGIGDLPACCHVVAAFEVVPDHAEVVHADVRELGAARHFADGPNTGRGCLEPFVDLDVAAISQFYPGQFQSDVLCVWPIAPTRSADECPRESFLPPSCSTTTVTESPDFPETRVTSCIQDRIDAFVPEQIRESFRHVIVFPVQQTVISIDDGNLAAEPAHGLRQLQADVAAADHNKVPGDLSQFERLDVREWLRIGQARNRFHRSPRTRAHDYIGSTEATSRSARENDFQSLRELRSVPIRE